MVEAEAEADPRLKMSVFKRRRNVFFKKRRRNDAKKKSTPSIMRHLGVF